MLSSARVVGAMLRRDMQILSKGFFDRFINYALFMFFQSIVFGYLTPLMGMPKEMITTIFLGSIIFAIAAVCFSRSLAIMNDVNFGKHINFELGLPIHRSWILVRYMLSLMIEFFVLSAPLLPFGKLYLGSLLNFSDMRILPLLGIYLCQLSFFASFFLALALLFDFHWYLDNVWPRILTPMQLLGCLFYSWYGLKSVFPFAARVMLFNPFVYLVEGLRGTILAPAGFLPAWFCALGLLTWTAVSLFFAHVGLKKRLDPV